MVVGDLNCDVAKASPDLHTRRLQFLCSLYQCDQLINEPTRVTETSATLIDLILTNRPENISNSGVIHLGISDHSMIFAVKKSLCQNLNRDLENSEILKTSSKMISLKIYLTSHGIQYINSTTLMYAGEFGNPFSLRYLIGMRLFGTRGQEGIQSPGLHRKSSNL